MGKRWEKSPPDLIACFDAALPRDEQVVRRTMFGYPCAFANGNMFGGLHKDRLFVRLPEAERRALLGEPGARPFEPMPGRPMAEYVVVPRPMSNPGLSRWLDTALRYAAGLPPKPGRAGRQTAP